MYRYPWQEAVLAVACELDPLGVNARLEKAESVVRERMSALCEEGDSEQREALVDALDALRMLK